MRNYPRVQQFTTQFETCVAPRNRTPSVRSVQRRGRRRTDRGVKQASCFYLEKSHVRSGGDIRMTPSPRTYRNGMLRLVCWQSAASEGPSEKTLAAAHSACLLIRFVVNLHGGHRLLHVAEYHVHMLVVRLCEPKSATHKRRRRVRASIHGAAAAPPRGGARRGCDARAACRAARARPAASRRHAPRETDESGPAARAPPPGLPRAATSPSRWAKRSGGDKGRAQLTSTLAGSRAGRCCRAHTTTQAQRHDTQRVERSSPSFF